MQPQPLLDPVHNTTCLPEPSQNHNFLDKLVHRQDAEEVEGGDGTRGAERQEVAFGDLQQYN